MNAVVSPLEFFRSKGIPHRRIEEWKYSDLRSVLDASSFEHPHGIVTIVGIPSAVEAISIGTDSLPEWASQRFRDIPTGGAMEAAARAFDPDAVALRVPRGVNVAEPLCIEFQSEGHAQIILLLEDGASLTFLETHNAGGECLRNISISIVLGKGAQLTHIWQAPFLPSLVAVETVLVRADRDARYRAHVVGSGAKLSRLEFDVALCGEGAEAELGGVSVLGGSAHADITTHIDHAVGNTTSRQLFKNVAGGHSRAIYQGKITVREGANGSDSRQTAKALLLGTRAEADLKPELEIFADDVKCAHGAAVGDLDQDSLFYLRSRGIPETEARMMLIRGFLEEPIAEIADEGLRTAAWAFVESGLARALEAQP